MPTVTSVRKGEQAARDAEIRLGCSAVIFDAQREKILLTQVPARRVDAGEAAAKTVLCAVSEETGRPAEGVFCFTFRFCRFFADFRL